MATDPASASPSLPAFTFPWTHSFPPFYTLQPNTSSRHAQLSAWSALILSYCRHHRLFKLRLSDALDSPLFHNRQLGKRLGLSDARAVVDFMRADQAGLAEWVDDERKPAAASGPGRGGEAAAGNVCWVWWRRPAEWAELVERWVEETGQKNTVLTVYELTEGDTSLGTEFHGLDPEVLLKALQVLVKRGKAQVFGGEDAQGVKFF